MLDVLILLEVMVLAHLPIRIGKSMRTRWCDQTFTRRSGESRGTHTAALEGLESTVLTRDMGAVFWEKATHTYLMYNTQYNYICLRRNSTLPLCDLPYFEINSKIDISSIQNVRTVRKVLLIDAWAGRFKPCHGFTLFSLDEFLNAF